MIGDFVKAVGGTIAHVTASTNVRSIRAKGLRPASQLAADAGIDPTDIALRNHRMQVGPATLNHQKPILHGLNAAHRVLDDHTPESWAHQLDQRVFLWPERKGQAFAASIKRDLAITILWLNTTKLAEAFREHIDLSPINSGNFTQGGAHARRGDWLYVPLAAGLDAFRHNRSKRGLKRTPDTVTEISLRCPIAPDLLTDLLIGHD
ncbi:hypothetical protein [Tateyamaria sp. ANG-S1]|uniref:DUF7002 family protein n=1 Tax=Tateyamaria sp. ANG-S1 TaxID=1577905 RepID=UPI00057D34F4|nr:hypothetical protein [Tateyamaria sp. ANG-S1]KIC48954.1 hypothetical protein RA29_14970 [Tateyamaria sp. ANG-S1]